MDHAPAHAVLSRHFRHCGSRLPGSLQNGALLFEAETPPTLDRSLRRRQCPPVTHRRDTCRFRSFHQLSVRYIAGASEYDAEDIAKVIARRPRPSYEERLAVFRPTGRPEPSREPFPIVSKGGGRPTF